MTESTEPTVLDTLTLEELWDEFCKRCTEATVIFEQDIPGSMESRLSTYRIWWNGSVVNAIGMVEYARIRLNKTIKSAELEFET